jgi:hypothetical protein
MIFDTEHNSKPLRGALHMNAHFKPTRLSSRLSVGTGGKQVLYNAVCAKPWNVTTASPNEPF